MGFESTLLNITKCFKFEKSLMFRSHIWHIRMNIRTCEWVIIYEKKFNELKLDFSHEADQSKCDVFHAFSQFTAIILSVENKDKEDIIL